MMSANSRTTIVVLLTNVEYFLGTKCVGVSDQGSKIKITLPLFHANGIREGPLLKVFPNKIFHPTLIPIDDVSGVTTIAMVHTNPSFLCSRISTVRILAELLCCED